ncbi:hypothetical protein B9Z19DRAFT_1134081 [Tuber borchii]|uniref:Fatty acid synthase beta subunit AflB /Fas1-like central domain-containing protein n=1 Tax=Tuber borchii TaxID=42251 RepID=A0A2T6ZES1_TUBBO|nr:hypothetical protein B9Z19DRAFT_1134081 [Tuber borchii]
MSTWAHFARASGAALKAGAKNSRIWIMKNQIITGAVVAGVTGGGGAIGGTYFVVSDNRAGRHEAKEEARRIHAHIHESHAILNNKIDRAYAMLDNQIEATQGLMISTAIATVKGFNGDKNHLKYFMTELDKWIEECKKTGHCVSIQFASSRPIDYLHVGSRSPHEGAMASSCGDPGPCPEISVTVNLIYVDPRAMGWQIPLLQPLRSAGVPIEGLTIGAGVPSIEVSNEYVETIGLKHISFKPGSIDANFIQQTRGMGSGHHSFEDFHQPILQMYGRFRRCGNIALVAGSGFGGAEDTYPYLTGFGSRMMTAKEAYTSLTAKKAICEAEGLDDKDWEKTCKGPAGGVITVRSEMGEPIHKLATRGVRLWAELDRTIFSLDKAKRLVELRKQHLEDITYAEVIHPSLKRLTGEFIRRIEERFTSVEGQASLLQNYADLDDPFATTEKILAHYPEANTQLINAQDMQHFLLLCQRRGQKPAVVDQDVGRTCILQGPMAAKYSTAVNKPIKDILDGIHNGHIAALTTDVYDGDESAILVVEYFGGKPITSLDDIENIPL